MVRYRNTYTSETFQDQPFQAEPPESQIPEPISSDFPSQNHHHRIPRTRLKVLQRCLTKLWIYFAIQVIYLAVLIYSRSPFLSLEAMGISIPCLLLHNNGEILTKGWINTDKKAFALKGILVVLILVYFSQIFRIGLEIGMSIKSLVIQSLVKIIIFYLAIAQDTFKIWDLRKKRLNPQVINITV